jgi:hypothetical protein
MKNNGATSEKIVDLVKGNNELETNEFDGEIYNIYKNWDDLKPVLNLLII